MNSTLDTILETITRSNIDSDLRWTLFDAIVRSKGYTLWRTSDSSFDIVKNESGHWGEYFDFMVSVTLEPDSDIVKCWSMTTDNPEYNKQRVERKINELDRNTNNGLRWDILCFAIVNEFP